MDYQLSIDIINYQFTCIPLFDESPYTRYPEIITKRHNKNGAFLVHIPSRVLFHRAGLPHQAINVATSIPADVQHKMTDMSVEF